MAQRPNTLLSAFSSSIQSLTFCVSPFSAASDIFLEMTDSSVESYESSSEISSLKRQRTSTSTTMISSGGTDEKKKPTATLIDLDVIDFRYTYHPYLSGLIIELNRFIIHNVIVEFEAFECCIDNLEI